jgi:hypothetical protein
MFMTPTEIVNEYQPADGDRADVPNDRWGEDTGRSRNTYGQTNPMNSRGGYMRGDYEETDSQMWARKLDESQMSPEDYHEHLHGAPKDESGIDIESLMNHESYPQPRGTHSSAWSSFEDREQSYLDRKAGEHDASYHAWANGPSIYQSVRDEGVQYPVHLGTQFGTSGKPQVTGGHHRIAAALDARPHDYIPVLHNEGGIREAKESSGSSGYKYR